MFNWLISTEYLGEMSFFYVNMISIHWLFSCVHASKVCFKAWLKLKLVHDWKSHHKSFQCEQAFSSDNCIVNSS